MGGLSQGAKRGRLPPLVLPREPRQTAPREIIEEAPIQLGYFHLAWHIPDIRHPDTPALDILASLLGNGRSSRLFREVREKKGLVTSAEAWTYSPGEQGLFGLSAVMAADKFAAAREALLEEVGARAGDARAGGGAGQSDQTIRRLHPGHAQNDARPGAGPGLQLDGGRGPEFFRTLPGRRAPGHAGRRCNGWPASI